MALITPTSPFQMELPFGSNYSDLLDSVIYSVNVTTSVPTALDQIEVVPTPLDPNSVNQSACFVPTTLESVPSPHGQAFLISLYSVTSFLALAGNAAVMIVAAVGRESAHTLRASLANLAVSDVVVGVLCVPFTYTDFMLGQWVWPHWLCPTAQYVQLLSVAVTSLTLTLIGVER